MKYAKWVLLILWIGAIGEASAQRKTVKEKATHKVVTPPKSRLEYSLDTITSRLDNMHLTLNSINHFSIAGFNTKKVESQLPEIQTTLQTISENLNLKNTIPEFKSLQLYQIMLENIKDQLESWRSSLFKFNVDLININNEITAFTHDSIIRQLVKDSLYRSMYVNELTVLETKWRQADTTTHSNLVKLTHLQTSVSQLYFQTIDLQDQVASFQEESSGKLFKKEYGYIWEFSDAEGSAIPTTKLASHSYSKQRQIMGYFIQEHWSEYIYILVVGMLFFFWVMFNYRKVNKSPDRVKILNDIDLDFLHRHSWLSSLVVMLCIIPFISIDAPAAYTHLVQLPLLITLTILFAIRWPRKYFFYWLILAGLYLLLSTTSIVLVARMNIRLWFLFLQILSITLGYWVITKIRTRFSFSILVRIVSILYLLCNLLAIICNVFGRLSLSKILSASAIFGMVQIIGLAVFVKSFMEALSLQEAASKMIAMNRASLFYEKAQAGFYRLFLVLASLSWLMLFAINLNLFTPIFDILTDWLDTPRTIGSLSVKIGDVLIFILIIYLSNIIQKYMGYLFGSKDEHALPQEGKKASRLVMMRLVLIIVGFLLAIVASGLPVDKITILLGALGVGIGFGLQTIVNNLVSGIILIFEQPFQIGDYIELNGKKGIVRDIGIRASRMVTEEGTEIIMPNGDLLSGEVINWTLQNNKVRIEVPFTIEAGPTLEQINAIVQETLGAHEGLSNDMKPQVLIKTASEKVLSFIIIAWVGNFSQIQSLKSEILRLMYLKLKEKGIKTA